jgi:hypothetical protein
MRKYENMSLKYKFIKKNIRKLVQFNSIRFNSIQFNII